MNKKIIFFIILVMLSSFVLGQNETCTDSDGGKDYYVKGTFSGVYNGAPLTNTDSCLDPSNWDDTYASDYLGEGYCENNELKVERITCPNGCQDGACIKETQTCTDSDGGKDYYKKGITYGKRFGSSTEFDTEADVCMSDSKLQEYECSDGSIFDINVRVAHSYECPNGCQDGACVKERTIIDCIDSDGKGNFDIKGYIILKYSDGTSKRIDDVCGYASGAPVYGANDYWCDGTHYFMSTQECEYGCKDGACLKETQTCTDSDGGKNYYKKGTASKGVAAFDDICYPGFLMEFYCEDGNIHNTEHICPNGCQNGVCIKETQECTDTDGGLNQYKKGVTSYYGYKYVDSCARGGESSSWSGGTAKIGDVIEYACYDNNGEFLCGPSYCHYKVLKCPEDKICKDGACIKSEDIATESVKCVFQNSQKGQECYSRNSEGLTFGCEGFETCIAHVKGRKGEKLTWKSTCGGYAYTTIDGNDEYAEFKCTPTTKCTDSDGGINYHMKGTVTGLLDGESATRTDHCGGINSEFLEEFYCEGNNIANTHAYKCPNGCKYGACIKEPECKPKYYRCPDGTNVPWCNCDQFGNSVCIISPENKCKRCGDSKCTAEEVNTCGEDCSIFKKYLILKDIGNYRFSSARYEKQENQYGKMTMYGAEYSFNDQNTKAIVIELKDAETANKFLKEGLSNTKHSTTNIAGNIVYLIDNERTVVWLHNNYLVGIQFMGYVRPQIKTIAPPPPSLPTTTEGVATVTGRVVIEHALEPTYAKIQTSQTARLREIKTQFEEKPIEIREIEHLPKNLIIAYLKLYPSDLIAKESVCGDGICEGDEQRKCPEDCAVPPPECPPLVAVHPEAKEKCLASNGEWVTGDIDARGCPIAPYCKRGGEISEIEKLAIIMKLEKVKIRITDLKDTAKSLSNYYRKRDDDNMAQVWNQAAREFDMLVKDINNAERRIKDLEIREIKIFIKEVIEEIRERLMKIVEIIISGLSESTEEAAGEVV